MLLHSKTIYLPLILLVLLTSCLTTTPASFEFDSEESYSYETEELKLTLIPIPEDELIDRFGSKGNIFADYPAKLTKKRLVVYKLNIDPGNLEAQIDLRNIILTIDETSSQSKYQSLLLESWETYLKNDEDRTTAESLAGKYMFDNKIRIEPETSQSGLIVFLKNFPDKGDRFLKIGLTTDDNKTEEILIPLTE